MPPPPLPLLHRYAAGYFPMIDDSDPAHPIFFWDRCPIRAILPVNAQTAARARRIARRSAPHFTIRYTTALEPVLRHLRRTKEHSWVQGPVPDIYRTLHAAHLLRTIEAWTPPPVIAPSPRRRFAHSVRPLRLVGALLGIVLPGVFIAETMYGLVPDASKTCLCQLVHDCHAAGFGFIDVQTPHDANSLEDTDGYDDAPSSTLPGTKLPQKPATPHPCIRLGEQHLPHAAFLSLLKTSLARHFPGTLRDWLTLARQVKDAAPAEPYPSEPQPIDPRRFLRLPRA